MATVINLGTFAAASVDRIQFSLVKDGVPWDADTVVFTFEAPDKRTQFSRDATRLSAGIFYYDTLVTDIPAVAQNAGIWNLGIAASEDAVTKLYPYDVVFTVNIEP